MKQKEIFSKIYLKEKNYFNLTRWEMIGFVKGRNNRILDIGCGTGNTGQVLMEKKKAVEVVGIEIVPEIAKVAKTKLNKVICGDMEVLDLPFEKDYFDYIMTGDVLEHLRDPWETLKKINYYLKKEGYIIASIPNIRNWCILKDLIFKGKWQYAESGILDNTHLRFFTKKSIIELFKNNGFSEVKIMPIFKIKIKKNKSYLINVLTFGLFEEFITGQYIVKAKK